LIVTYPISIWHPQLGMTALEFCQDLWHQNIRVPGLLYGVVLCYPTFNHFGTIPVCDRQTHEYTTTAYTVLA